MISGEILIRAISAIVNPVWGITNKIQSKNQETYIEHIKVKYKECFIEPHPIGDIDCSVSKLIEAAHNIVNFKERGNSFSGYMVRNKFSHLYSRAKIIHDFTDNNSTYGTTNLLKIATNENNEDVAFLETHKYVISKFRTVFRDFNKHIFKNI